ncbi:cbb3-type cytochrome c oxidase subunit 3 [Novosphingobium pituita]|uniref:CcoQ/FixQ family Cbb3-type cytochrome c oxidase assembly chaperone n=1 Tax=Novosphingobium pituita TaxID=3056842 RepID=A0ABQ6PBM6_9SPHN|nr:cbb3-type cytochrome c oxidase subunit 3 [Novosphingobium sp. IK01]MDK4806487.1 cbb3-type cytochrome c oxidase subunit 3 [Novosphingobium aromaticivorans]GMM62285.1 CcoQ/FixQ family Cbb3-type cytochrome c oxidase assembly chaperone [Novosphingobium sp. IK01]HIQ19487.1 cbb3-type cytochrome c oxidase subunit 3 [Novosphingobium capsulatum]
MSTYDFLRHFADSWALVVMAAIFLGLCIWPFRRGGKASGQEAAASIFTEDHDG